MSLQFEKELQSYCIMAIFLKAKGNLVENDEMQTCKNCTRLCISILTYSIQTTAPKTSLTHLKFGHVHIWRAAWIVKHPLRNICQILFRVSPRLMHTIASVSQHTHHILLLILGSPIFQICLDCSSSYLNKSIYIIDQVKWFIGACEWERGKNFSTVSAMFTHNLREDGAHIKQITGTCRCRLSSSTSSPSTMPKQPIKGLTSHKQSMVRPNRPFPSGEQFLWSKHQSRKRN